jgi:hypothetical protein
MGMQKHACVGTKRKLAPACHVGQTAPLHHHAGVTSRTLAWAQIAKSIWSAGCACPIQESELEHAHLTTQATVC